MPKIRQYIVYTGSMLQPRWIFTSMNKAEAYAAYNRLYSKKERAILVEVLSDSADSK